MKRVRLIARRILAGLPGHPGTVILLMLVLLGAVAGARRDPFSVRYVVLGALVMLGIYGPVYLISAYEIGCGSSVSPSSQGRYNMIGSEVTSSVRTGETVWLVGQTREPSWEVQGVFITEGEAVSACRTERYFICPLQLGQQLPDETTDVPAGARYPLVEGQVEGQ